MNIFSLKNEALKLDLSPSLISKYIFDMPTFQVFFYALTTYMCTFKKYIIVVEGLFYFIIASYHMESCLKHLCLSEVLRSELAQTEWKS